MKKTIQNLSIIIFLAVLLTISGIAGCGSGGEPNSTFDSGASAPPASSPTTPEEDNSDNNSDDGNPITITETCEPLEAPDPSDEIIRVSPGDAGSLHTIIGSANPKTTIYLEDGTYSISNDIYINNDHITIRSLSGNRSKVIIDGNYESYIFQVNAPYTTIADITIKRAQYHLIHTNNHGNHAKLYNLQLLDSKQQFIKVSSSSNDIDYGTLACSSLELTEEGEPNIDERYADGCYTGGIDAHKARGWIVKDNVFTNIYCKDKGLAEPAIHFWSMSRDTVVERNTIINCARGIGFGHGGGGDRDYGTDKPWEDDPDFDINAPLRHIGGIIKNNLVYSDIGSYFDSGIYLWAAWGAEVYNNTIYTSSAFSSIETRYSNTTAEIKNNLIFKPIMFRSGTNNIITDANFNFDYATSDMFVDVENLDFNLNETATDAIDQGVIIEDVNNNSLVPFDIDLKQRDEIPDIGAYEFQ